MHQPSAVGTGIEANLDQKGLWFGAKVVDDAAWKKVQNKVYRGFSLGGRVTKRDPKNPRHILGIDLVEVSLVDRPCNPDASFQLIKRDKSGDLHMTDGFRKVACIAPRDVLDVATACLPQLLMKYLPEGKFRFGGEFASPHPSAPPKRQRFYKADIVVNSRGAWRDNLVGAQGGNIISLLAHVQNRSQGAVGADLALSLNPSDAMNGHAVRPGLIGRSKADDANPPDDSGADLKRLLDQAALISRRDGITKADALVKVAMQQRKRR